MNLLADLYSTIDSKKRQLKGLLSDPVETIRQGLLNFRDDQSKLLNDFGVGYQTPGYKSVLATPEQVKAARQSVADWGANQGIGAATVWHGSPHKFNKFDSSKIGTGEGAQAYGHGLYLAESPEVASSYQKMLAEPAIDGKSLSELGYSKKAIDTVKYTIANADNLRAERFAQQGVPEYVQAVDALKKINGQAGSLYKVDLPDEAIAKMLDWDKPLSQQHQDVQAAVAKFKTANIPAEGLDMGGGGKILANHDGQVKPESSSPWVLKSGGSLFDISQKDVERMLMADKGEAAYTRMTANLGGQPQATEALRNAGIPGIRYLDGGSRGAGQGTSNYVIFPGNESLLTILERNGQPVGLLD